MSFSCPHRTEKESCSSPIPFVWLRYLWADVPQGSNKTRRKIYLVTTQLSSTSINQLLAHHHSYISFHTRALCSFQDLCRAPGTLCTPENHCHKTPALQSALCSWKRWLNHPCDPDSLANLCRKLWQLTKTPMILGNKQKKSLTNHRYQGLKENRASQARGGCYS